MKREQWIIINRTNRDIVISDLPKLPSLGRKGKPGHSFDTLRFYPKTKIEQSQALNSYILSNKISIIKKRDGIISINSSNPSVVNDAIQIAEINELTGEINNLSKNGFIDYSDATTAITPIPLVADTWTTITNDGAGSNTNIAYPPSSVTQLLNVSTGAIDVSQLKLGDSIIVRNDFQITPDINNSNLEFRYSLGTGLGSYTLERVIGRLDSGAGIPYRFSLTSDFIYMGDENTRDNPIVIQVKLSDTGSIKNNGLAILVVRQ